VRGGGETASGIIHTLVSCGFNVIVSETENSSAVRSGSAYCEALYDGETRIDGISCLRVQDVQEAEQIFALGMAALVKDDGEVFNNVCADILIDTVGGDCNINAKYKIGLGSGYLVGKDADCVVETVGRDIGRVLYKGYARSIVGFDGVNSVYAPLGGTAVNVMKVGDEVRYDSVITKIGYNNVTAGENGYIHALVRDGHNVKYGMKIAEIATQKHDCFSVSVKNRCIAGGVLEAVVKHLNKAEDDRIE
jgi:xanthine dehydrogenase accessory factor